MTDTLTLQRLMALRINALIERDQLQQRIINLDRELEVLERKRVERCQQVTREAIEVLEG